MNTISGDLGQDRAALAGYVAARDEELAALPVRQLRGAAQQRTAEQLHRACRVARENFLRAHVDAVHAELTDGGQHRMRLPELAELGAVAFRGLLPTARQLAAERGKLQEHKEGWEIEHALFFRSLFASPTVGPQVLEAMLMPTARALAVLPRFQRAGVAELGVVHIERVAGAAHVTIANNHSLNAEDEKLVEDLETAIDLVLLDPACQVGVLRGGEMTHPRYLGRRVFSAGLNLKELFAGRISLANFVLRRELCCLGKIRHGLVVDDSAWPAQWVQKPWLAAVDGFAIGGGAQLLLTVDRVIAAADAYFRLPAAQEGLLPGTATVRLGRIAGGRVARQVLLWGRTIRAGEPDARLLFDEVVDPDLVATAVDEAAERLAGPGVVANRRMLTLAEEPVELFRTYLAEFVLHQALRLYSPDVLARLRESWR